MNREQKMMEALSKIKAIVEDYDLAAFVTLVVPGDSVYYCNVSTSFTCAKFDDFGKIRVSTVGLQIGKDEKQKLVEDTCNVVALLGTTVGEKGFALLMASKRLDETAGAEHTKPIESFTIKNQN